MSVDCKAILDGNFPPMEIAEMIKCFYGADIPHDLQLSGHKPHTLPH